MKKVSLSIIALLVFLTPVFAQQELSIYLQPDSPLKLSNATARWRKSNDDQGQKVDMLTVHFDLLNLSGKTIQAYSIRFFERDFKTDIGGILFAYSPYPTGILKPQQSQNEVYGEVSYDPEKLSNLKIAIDFVEYTDGSIWGIDISKSAEQLAGFIAGYKAGQEYLEKINQQKGVEFTIEELEKMINILPPQNQTQIWEMGFKNGLKNLSYRIKEAYKKEGIKAVEAELQKALFIPA